MKKILIIDKNHPLLVEEFLRLGHWVEEDYSSDFATICKKISDVDALIVRSRLPIKEELIECAKNLKCIGRVGSGLENIDVEFAKSRGISVVNSPEGNAPAVAEHCVGMLLSLMHKIQNSFFDIKNKRWNRQFVGDEILGKTIGIIGYGNTGKSFAKKLSGMGVKIIFYDILPMLSDEFATSVSLEELQNQSQIVSLHLPETAETYHILNEEFISKMVLPFYLLNTSRGNCIKTKDAIQGIKIGKILGMALDVMEDENSNFQVNFSAEHWDFLLTSEKVLLTSHIAGKSIQSEERLAKIIVEKVNQLFY